MPNQDVQRLAERYPARRVLITGATSGLGEALALEFARHGWRIGVSGRSSDKVAVAARKVREVGGDALEIRLEVTDRRQFEDAAAIVGRTWGGLDILINNACIASGGRIDELTPESWRTALDTNLWGVIHGCTVFVPHPLHRHLPGTLSVGHLRPAKIESASGVGRVKDSAHGWRSPPRTRSSTPRAPLRRARRGAALRWWVGSGRASW